MNHKKSFIKGALCGALAMLLIIIVALFFVVKVSMGHMNVMVDPEVNQKLGTMKGYIDAQYLREVDEESLKEGIFHGYIEGLDDPYSMYFDEEEMKDFKETTSGKYEGIGAVLTQDRDTGMITLTHLFKESPAKKAKLMENDILYKVDGEVISGQELTEVVRKIKGKENTKVKITVLRGKDNQEVEVEVTRAKVENETVESEMLPDKIGYLAISEFDDVTYGQFNENLESLEEKGAKALLVDLRGNPGGNLSTVCAILDRILPEGLVVYTEDKEGKRQEFQSDEEHQYEYPIAVLVNGNSASASEIFAGAVQDYGIGKIIGTTTYGKGVVQRVFPFKDGSSVKLTTSEYFTPKGRNIDGKGITPDVEIKYEFDEKDPEADNQMERAIKELKKEM